jgi:hypothetical protein
MADDRIDQEPVARRIHDHVPYTIDWSCHRVPVVHDIEHSVVVVLLGHVQLGTSDTNFAAGEVGQAVHLKAAALPRQMSQVILPISGIKENEIYAPNFRHGENVVLIRHPHGGTFEIPELIVNNRNVEARSLIERAADAVGIHPKVAERLSGADFDGDTVIVIPNKHGLIKTTSPLAALKNFDHKTMYKKYDGMEVMDDKTKQLKMGEISNLITDMTIKGAKPEEIARAIRHSMVVIDAPKHELNYKQSYIDNNIKDLRERYQGGAKSGA